ncbi:MAG: exodeoxyribonuclease VII small subunit [Dissulfurimicrobium sp.]|uniref:exodeoxyribonuclease VII small subunit n=1 Tax=Dissulfurimicrobium TaxID=1769732 RepID=UPI001EDB6694|nr:exodeoxyribonuclease VII small subunit [Dissulfurimicrobium hydrothermale]UKL13178.1 exodeoxyribonuclease VII small subunit [Dissulfurimicrobium hydrothermale]
MSSKKMRFEAAMSRLEGIVGELESERLSLEDALKLYEEGIKLARYCATYLDSIERRIDELAKGDDGIVIRPSDIDKEVDKS